MMKHSNTKRLSTLVLVLAFILSIHTTNAQGPNAPEAGGFEPVSATDMVNLTNGNLSYVLPLTNIDGFPVTLSYHAGITMDMQASWVGLGWYLNPGAINRSITNTPDDWKSGVGINFNSYEATVDYFGVSVEFGFPGTVSVGVGMNWGGGQGLSGSVSANVGLNAGTAGMLKGGASVSASTTGDVTVGVGVGINLPGDINVGASASYSLQNQWNLGIGVGQSLGDSKDLGFISLGYSLKGGFGIGTAGNATGKAIGRAGNAGGAGMQSSSMSQGDASVDQQSFGVALPLHFVGIPITLGFSKTKVKINIKKGFREEEYGALYASAYNYSDNSALIYDSGITDKTNISYPITFNAQYGDMAARTKSLDVYATSIPQTGGDFIADNSSAIERSNFNFIGYDSYDVAAEGMLGSMTPHVFKNATLFGKGQRTTNQAGEDIHAFWHHGTSSSAVSRELGNPDNIYNNNDFYFTFNGQFTASEKTTPAIINTSITNLANNIDDLLYVGNHIGASASATYRGRALTPNYVEVFTNREIYDSRLDAYRGLITPKNVPDSQRIDLKKFDPDGIGAYKITAPDGKTYHFSLPVYHYEQIHRSLIDNVEDASFNVANVNEKRQYSRYATHWLLTAITGPDYVDRPDPRHNNERGTFNKEDYGYWVELEYGKWSDGYVWRTPYQDRVYQYNTNLKDEIESKDKGNYSFGRKQLYYLDKINTKNKTALFVKDIRYDAIGKDLKFKYTRSNSDGTLGSSINSTHILNKTNSGVYVRENEGVHYKREYSLKLSKIIVVQSEDGKDLSKSRNFTNSLNHRELYSNYVSNDECWPNWESRDFANLYTSNYKYNIHNERDVLDIKDITSNFIEDKALEVIEFNHSYKLARQSPSSQDAPNDLIFNNVLYGNSRKGKLTLESVVKKGKKGIYYMPPTRFSYYMENEPNVSLPTVTTNAIPSAQAIKDYVVARREKVDAWGFLQSDPNDSENLVKAWSLKDIKMPTGAKISINYDEDDYFTEAFSKRYWENGLLAKFTLENDRKYIYFKQNTNIITNDTINFQDYFNVGDKVYLDVQYFRNPIKYTRDHRYADYSGAFDLVWVNTNEIKIALPSNTEGNAYRNHENCGKTPWAATKLYGYHSGIGVVQAFANYYDAFGDKKCGWEADGESHFAYRILANKVPEEQKGGGLRVAELTTLDGLGNHVYRVKYDYSHPENSEEAGRPVSSGITSYAPVNGLKFVPYQSEVPAPGVMYEYVTMAETDTTGNYNAKTRYRHHVLKPVDNIFDPNIKMEALDANSTYEDKLFWAKVTDNYSDLTGMTSNKIHAQKIDIHINSAILGQIKSIENLNSEGQVMLKTENFYANGTRLLESNGINNFVRESFNSMKSIFRTNRDGNIIFDVKRELSISSKTEYKNLMKSSIIHSNGQQAETVYSDVDPWLNSFRQTETTTADGKKIRTIKVPAYEKYEGMGSKVIDPNYKNMLSQEAMSITQIEVDNQWRTLNASLSTWKSDWRYRNELGEESNSSNEVPVWRNHKSYIWRGDINPVTGAYAANVTPTSNHFNWGTSTPSSTSKWLNVSEVTRYSHWSQPLETRDLNNNYGSIKMADNFDKVEATGNAKYTELYYCGAEHVVSGDNFAGEVKGANLRSNTYAHTGLWSVRNLSTSDKIFEINTSVSTSATGAAMRPGQYKVSLWARVNSNNDNSGIVIKVNGSTYHKQDVVQAGAWALYNYYITIPPHGSQVNIHAQVTNATNIYLDDFRMHPVASSMTSFVYNQATDELISILGPNNLAVKYVYDPAGRLCKTFEEVANSGNFVGGFKLTSQNEYYYKDVAVPDCGDCCTTE